MIPTVSSLSRKVINQVIIQENNEPLITIPFSEKLTHREGEFLIPQLRETAVEMLVRASQKLPDGYKLCVLTAYRTREMQQKLWDNKSLIVKKKFWYFPRFIRDRITRKYCALPTGNGPHQTGGAVDVTILDIHGKELDMGMDSPFGTYYGERCHTACQNITEDQKKNRELLYSIMTQAGFINYPLEWWHYCYGDRMWAAYGGKQVARYGSILV